MKHVIIGVLCWFIFALFIIYCLKKNIIYYKIGGTVKEKLFIQQQYYLINKYDDGETGAFSINSFDSDLYEINKHYTFILLKVK